MSTDPGSHPGPETSPAAGPTAANVTPLPPRPAVPPAESAELAAAAARLGRGSVLVVGDAMLDRYVYGTVTRISPEAPIPIVTVEREIALPGGAGNVVRNLTALGAAAAFVSVVGDDQAGSDLTGLVGGQPNVEPWLLVQGGRTTTRKTRYISQGQQLMRADREETGPIHPKLAERMLRIAHDALAATSVTVLSDYGKGVLCGDVPQRIIAAARDLNRRVVVDPRGADYARYRGADVITPNLRELEAASGRAVDDEAALVAAAQHLRDAHAFGAVLVTRAAEGMTLVDGNGARHFPAEAAEVFDVSGAGDTAVATLAAALAAGLDLPVAARLANIAAGIAVGRAGTAVVRIPDLQVALSAQGGVLRKIVTREAAVDQAERWRRMGWRTGFGSGCFDPLHPAQVQALEQARGECDRLVVGLYSDGSTRQLKGSSRPKEAEASRAAALASLAAVDLVVIFEEDTPDALRDALRPDMVIPDAEADRASSVTKLRG